MFAPEEQTDLARLAGEDYRRRYFSLWTLREAWSKALGHGLLRMPPGIGFVHRADSDYALHDADRKERSGDWQLSVQFPTTEHVLAVAIRARHKPQRRIATHWLTP